MYFKWSVFTQYALMSTASFKGIKFKLQQIERKIVQEDLVG
jgi:hypothetical protein